MIHASIEEDKEPKLSTKLQHIFNLKSFHVLIGLFMDITIYLLFGWFSLQRIELIS